MTNSDLEIDAMNVIARALTPLDDETKRRVVSWAASRFGMAAPALQRPPDQRDHAASETSVGTYETFAELFDAASPSIDKERALVAAYWTQICENQPSFASQTLNSNLKDLGHPLSNVTVALGHLKDERPALILQLKKSGISKQARKTYKLTREGAIRVRSMISKENL